MICDLLIPTVGRADRLAALLRNIWETSPEGVTPILVLDPDDADSIDVAFNSGAVMVVAGGSYPVKTNFAYEAGNGNYVLPTADDVVFHADWWVPVQAAFGDPGVQVVGTNDLSPQSHDGHATMPVLRRSYCEHPGASWGEPGKVFCEAYHHNYVETEVCGLAVHRTVWRYEPEAVIEHLHPSWGGRPADGTDERGNQKNFEPDRNLYEARRADWIRT